MHTLGIGLLLGVAQDVGANNEPSGAQLELFDGDCEVRPHLGGLEGRVYRGHDGVRRWFDEVYADWTEFCPELRTFCEVEGSLLVAGSIRARARVSGVALDTPMWWRCTCRDGRLLCMDAFREPTDTHREAGLALN